MRSVILPFPRRSKFTRVSLTVALPLQALLINEWLRPVVDPMFEPPLIAAVAIVAWTCGLSYALGALALSSVLLLYFYIPPFYSFHLQDSYTIVKFVFFLGANAVTVGLIANLYRAQAELAASEQLRRNLSELIPFGGWVSDPRGNMLHVSDSFLSTFGATLQDCTGLGWTQFIDENQRDMVVAEWKACMQSGYFWDYEYRMHNRNGERFVVLSRGVPVRSSGGRVRSWVGIHLDITDRERFIEERVRQARDIARFNAELEQLAYVSAHDLQEPLRVIASYLQLLERRYKGRLDPEADQFIDFAVEGANRLRSLLQDLLALQQIGKGARERGMHHLSDLVEKAVSNLGLTAEGAEIRCGPLPEVHCDEYEFAQLFEHLIENAARYVRDGVHPVIEITSERSSEGWVISVKDNGIGIEPQYARRIFDVFQRLHSRAQYPGTGIGLAICRKVVEVHGGRIWAESKPGEGSTFRFTIPESS